MDNLVITVARGFGSCGKRIAKQIADDLGIHCYENRILMLASQMSGLDEEVFAEVNEKLRNQNVFSAFLKGLPMQRSPKVEDRKFVSDEKLFEYQKQIIDTFINAIYIFDDKLVFTYNFKDGTEAIPLKAVEDAFGSDLTQVAPPSLSESDSFQAFLLSVLHNFTSKRGSKGEFIPYFAFLR